MSPSICFASCLPHSHRPGSAHETCLGSVFQRTQVKSGRKITNTCKILRASLSNTVATIHMWLLSTGNVVSMNQDVLSLKKKKKTNWDFKELAQQKSHYNFILVIYWKDTEKAMAPHSSTLAWKIPWMEKPGRLQSMGSLRIRYNWATSLSLFTFMHWRRKWQPTPVFLPGESQGPGSLVSCRLWGRTESDTTEVT